MRRYGSTVRALAEGRYHRAGADVNAKFRRRLSGGLNTECRHPRSLFNQRDAQQVRARCTACYFMNITSKCSSR